MELCMDVKGSQINIGVQLKPFVAMYIRGLAIHHKYWGRLNIDSECTVQGQ